MFVLPGTSGCGKPIFRRRSPRRRTRAVRFSVPIKINSRSGAARYWTFSMRRTPAFNAAVLVAASQYASLFADYQLLAANGDLLRGLNLAPPPQAQAIARAQNGVPTTAPAEIDGRYSPAAPADTMVIL